MVHLDDAMPAASAVVRPDRPLPLTLGAVFTISCEKNHAPNQIAMRRASQGMCTAVGLVVAARGTTHVASRESLNPAEKRCPGGGGGLQLRAQ